MGWNESGGDNRKMINRSSSKRDDVKRTQKAESGDVLRDGYQVLSRAERPNVDNRKPSRPVVRQREMPDKDGHYPKGDDVFSPFDTD